MKTRTHLCCLVMLLSLGLAACAPEKPPYASVRSEAINSLDRISAEVPDPKEIVRDPDQEPYSCNDPELTSTQSEGAFYTGHWAIFGAEDFDRESFISSLPELLGEQWEVQDLGLEVSFAYAYLVNTDSDVQINVRAIERDGRPALDLTAISRCGSLPNSERATTFPPTAARAASH